MKTSVVVFPGSNCEMDTIRAVETLTGRAPELAWHKDPLPAGTELVLLPGGFSYGDYLRAGAIARFSPVMQSVIEHANAGGLVLGICNGFQILLEAGLLPGAMVRNESLHFVCKWTHLKTERKDLAFTAGVPDVLKIPVAHATGNYFIDAEGLARLESNNQVVFRYCDADGNVTPQANPNGSIANIAGICNERGNVLGMMPHPERAISQELGSDAGATILRAALGCVTANV
jgi:phosphoribosylformylglycinamidine synthase